MAKRHKILAALDEVVDWTKGRGQLSVTMPGQKARVMTVDEYKAAKKKVVK